MVFLLLGQLFILTALLLSLLQNANNHKIKEVVSFSLQLFVRLGRHFCVSLDQYFAQCFNQWCEVELEWFGEFREIIPKLRIVVLQCLQVQSDDIHILEIMTLLQSLPLLRQLHHPIYLNDKVTIVPCDFFNEHNQCRVIGVQYILQSGSIPEVMAPKLVE